MPAAAPVVEEVVPVAEPEVTPAAAVVADDSRMVTVPFVALKSFLCKHKQYMLRISLKCLTTQQKEE